MLTKEVSIDDIDFNSREFELFKSQPDQKLESSIFSLGVINPVKLLKKENSFTVITGWKRINVLIKLKIDKIPAQVFEEGELTQLSLFSYIYTDNKDRFTELEKAELILKLIKTGELKDEEIMNQFLPVISVNPSVNNLNKYKNIAQIENEFKEACFNEQITFEQLQMLAELTNTDFRKSFYTNFLKQFKFNNNEARDLLKDVETICIRNRTTPDKLLKEINDTSSKKDDKETIRKTVKKICYPRLSETEEKYNELVKELCLGDSARLINHPYFESNDVELRIKIKEQNELRREINSLRDAVDNGKIEELLNLIQEGK